ARAIGDEKYGSRVHDRSALSCGEALAAAPTIAPIIRKASRSSVLIFHACRASTESKKNDRAAPHACGSEFNFWSFPCLTSSKRPHWSFRSKI
ncbi:MAG: hypothetical protein KKC79_04040, partial [Gammaproteobacteria bacterium]|nr:hypothetical protein [Gammaproteobacteria bacterium]